MPVAPLDRDILRLAVPALGALVAEPLFLLTDTALVGHLGEVPLAALAIAGAIVQTAIGLLVFLAYATTPAVARRLGSGDRAGAVRAGIDGMWLALGLGAVVVVLGVLFSRAVVGLFTSDALVAADATTYLLVSLVGLPAMLLVIAATGLLRGLHDTRTPLVVAVSGFAANAGLNALFIYGLGWGIAGSAAGTVVAQWAMATVYIVIAVRAASSSGAPLRPGVDGVGAAAASGAWLFVRTASLRAAMLATVAVASSFGVAELGAFQIALTLFSTLAFMLDALAIAGQAMIGHALGAADVPRVQLITRRLVRWGVGAGVVLGVATLAVSPLLGPVFSSSPEVQSGLTAVVVTMALGIPLAGFVFVLDGVLIGAGDARYLALTGLVNVALYAPLLWLVAVLHPAGAAAGAGAFDAAGGTSAFAWAGAGLANVGAAFADHAALVWLWAAFGFGYIGARALTLGLRARTSSWIRPGAA